MFNFVKLTNFNYEKILLTLMALVFAFACLNGQTITTTTITGSLKVNDSLQVINNINSAGNIKAEGEIVSKDTMRAQKDVLVDGNAVIDGNLKVGGTTNVGNLRVGGNLSIGPYSPSTPSPCELSAVIVVPDPFNPGGSILTPVGPNMAHEIELAYDLNPCAPQVPAPPVIIPFTWQTYGNHINSNNRWIGSIENFDFNIKTNSAYRMVLKNNGDIGIGAFAGNGINTVGIKYSLFISNTGEVNAGYKIPVIIILLLSNPMALLILVLGALKLQGKQPMPC